MTKSLLYMEKSFSVIIFSINVAGTTLVIMKALEKLYWLFDLQQTNPKGLAL